MNEDELIVKNAEKKILEIKKRMNEINQYLKIGKKEKNKIDGQLDKIKKIISEQKEFQTNEFIKRTLETINCLDGKTQRLIELKKDHNKIFKGDIKKQKEIENEIRRIIEEINLCLNDLLKELNPIISSKNEYF